MEVKNLLLACALLSSASVANASDLQVSSWDDLNNNRGNLKNAYWLQQDINNWGGELKIGEGTSDTGAWELIDSGHHLDGNWGSGFSIRSNIEGFALRNFNEKEGSGIFHFSNTGAFGGPFINEGRGSVLYNEGTAQILYSNFYENYAKYGGVIYNANGAKFAEISFSEFYNNQADNEGGAIYNAGTIENIGDTKFTNNTAAGGQGGAIYNAGTINIIRNVDFGAKTTNDSGNVSYAGGNIAYEGGGAIYNAENSTIGTILNSNFYGNKNHYDGKNGAAINNKGTINTIENSVFEDNGGWIEGQGIASVGGAIFNENKIGSIIGSTKFVLNRSQYGGGAIFNKGTIDTLTAEFTNNTAENQGGGAVKNTEGGSITIITGSKFENNIAAGDDGKGGAIRNNTTIGTISNSEFYSNSSNDFGGALANVGGKITTIDGATFGEENMANLGASGGAINNQDSAEIGAITGSTFAYNIAQETTGFDQGNGGAIRNFNQSSIKTIKDTIFEANIASGLKQQYTKDLTHVYGGAIYNMKNSTIDTIENATFKNNIVHAYENNGVDDNKKGYAHGGAISNGGGYVITGENNGEEQGDSSSKITTISGSTFEGNEAQGTGAYGGAIFNSKNGGGIGNIIGGSFKNNKAKASIIALGGAIYTERDMLLTADGSSENTKTLEFSGNTMEDTHNGESQNAIFVNLTSKDNPETLTLNSINEGIIRFDDEIDGGTDNGSGTIKRNGEDYNLALSGDDSSQIILNNRIINANAVLNDTNLTIGLTGSNTSDVFASEYTTLNAQSGNISLIDSKIGNYNINKLIAQDTKWGIDVDWSGEKPVADTITLTSKDSSGLVKLKALNIINTDNIEAGENLVQVIKGASGDENEANVKLSIDDLDISKADFYRTEVYSNTIITDIDDAITTGTTDTKDDSLLIKGKIYDTLWYICTLETKTPTETKKFIFDNSKPVYEYSSDEPLGVVGDLTIQGDSPTKHIIDFKEVTSFGVEEDAKLTINNAGIVNAKEITNDGTLKTSGAIFQDVNNIVNNNKAEFTNTVFASEDDVITNNADMTISSSVVNSTIDNSSVITLTGTNSLNGKISGSNGVLDMKDGVQNINNIIDSQTIVNNGAVTNVNNLDFINNNNNILTVNNGIVNIPALGLNTLTLNQLNMNGGTVNIASVDVDLLGRQMGKISAPDSLASTGGVITINNLNVISDAAENYTELNFADGAFADRVENTVHHVDTQISRYDVDYNKQTGNFAFSRPQGYKGFNPAVLASAVATQVGGYLSELSTVEHSFYHIDTWGMLPQKDRFTESNANKYAITDSVGGYQNNSNAGIWVRPYTSFESVSLTDGPDVKTITYGTLVGGDTDFIDLGRGWKGVISTFVGYNGSTQDYSNVSTYQNGGVLGATASFYKGKFYTALTANAGAAVGDAHTAAGNDTFAMFMTGVASKSGYNWELNDGKFIVQPSLMLGYTYINNFNYTSSAGVKIDSNPLNAIQISPKVRFISNLENGWQPYAQIGMMWNILDKTSVTANDVRLPQLGIGPYVEYGLGLQRRWSEDSRYSAFGQAMVRNGSRNGIALTFGFKAMLGKGKVQNVNRETHKVVIK